MEFISVQKYLVMSPKKARLVADVVRKLSPIEAIGRLPFTNKRAALPLVKVIKSALASAKAKGVSEEALIIKEIQINEGPRLKRGIAVSRGQWHPIKKRMAHIRVILATTTKELLPAKTQESKIEVKTENKSKDMKVTKKVVKPTKKGKTNGKES
jgi:large subunit ribosomal protein L22